MISFVPAKILVLRCRIIFSFSSKGTVDYDKLDLAESVSGCLEFCKTQPEPSKAPLLNHLQLLMDRAQQLSRILGEA